MSVYNYFYVSGSLLLLCIIGGNCSSPFRDERKCGEAICRAEQLNDEMKFHYKEGSIYSYKYTVNGTTWVMGGPPIQSALHLSAKVTLRFLTACDGILFINEVDIRQSYMNSSKLSERDHGPRNRLTFIKSLEEYPLRFSYSDGLIEELCPHSMESSWALNIKRGFLSAFQNTMKRLDLEHKGEEDDVHGHCKVEYSLGTATSSALTILKTKDLSSCGDKFGVLSSVRGSPYTFANLEQSMPAVLSLSTCSQIVDRNLLSGVECSESHRLRSLARGAAGAYMNIQQNMELVSVYVPPLAPSFAKNVTNADDDDDGEMAGFGNDDDDEDEEDTTEPVDQQQGSSPWIITRNPDPYTSSLISKSLDNVLRREGLHFKHTFNMAHNHNQYNTARNILLSFCTSLKKEVGHSSGELFEALVTVLRGLSTADMMSLSKDANQICQDDRNPFDDALEAVGTSSSVAVIRERIFKSDASPERKRSWINSLTFIAKPDLAVLVEALWIIRARDNYPNILLSFSSLAHSYCMDVGRDACVKTEPILKLTKMYEKTFSATGCNTRNRKELQELLMYLKGMANFGMRTNGTIQAIVSCITRNDKNEIRVAAIDAIRRMPCEGDGELLPVLKSLFENQLEDAEVRIASFIGIMRCPNYPIIRWLKKTLEIEQVNQVGSFVWTFLTNLQETSLPSKAELQALLADEHLGSKFSTDFRKFSRNFEFSSFYQDLNLGVALDGNLIYSETSYLPRSASVNLTVDLFGESINVLEATLRGESFEHYVESIFIPSGSSSKANLSSSSAASATGSNTRRGRRGTLGGQHQQKSKRKMRTLALEYDAMKRYYSDPIASISLKTFGSEIFFQRYVGQDEQKRVFSNPFKIFEKLAKSEPTNWEKSRLLLDSSYIIPTGAGFPLNLTAQASSIIRMESESLIDAFPNFEGVKVTGKFIPSAMLTVSGMMSLSAGDIHTGLKIRAHLRSSTAVEGTFHVKGMNLVNVEFGLPKEKLELLEYKSQLMFMDGDEFVPWEEVNNSPSSGSQDRVCSHERLGVKLCWASHFSVDGAGSLIRAGTTSSEEHDDETLFVPYFPLNGPSYFTLTLDKANPSLLKTRFRYLWNNNQTATELDLSSSSFSGPNKENMMEERLGLNVILLKEDQILNGELKLPFVNFKMKGGLEKDWRKGQLELNVMRQSSNIFSSSISFNTLVDDGKRIFKPTLSIHQHSKQILGAEASVEIYGDGNVLGKGLLDYGDDGEMKLELEGAYNDSSVTLNWMAGYGNGETIKSTSTLLFLHAGSQKRHYSKETTKTAIDMTLNFSQFPHYNLAASWKFQNSDEGFETHGDFIQGSKYHKKDISNLLIRWELTSYRSHEGSRRKALVYVSKLSENIEWNLEGGFNTQGKSMDSAINLRYAPGKSIESSLSLRRAPGLLTFVNAGWNISLPHQHPLILSFNLEEKAYRVYQSQIVTDWHVNKLVLDIEVSDRSRRHRLDTSCTLGIKTNGIDNLKLGLHILSEDKESKLQLYSDYKSEMNTLELGHNVVVGRFGRKHKLVGSISCGDNVYLIMSEIDLEYGLYFILKTDLGSKFSDIYIRLRGTNQIGVRTLALEYTWNINNNQQQQHKKQFLLDFILDQSQDEIAKTTAIVILPTGIEYGVQTETQFNEEDESVAVVGKVLWKHNENPSHLHLNGRVGRRMPSQDDDEAYDASLQLSTPFSSLKNVSFNLRLDFVEERSICQIHFDSSWGDDERMSGIFESKLMQETGKDEHHQQLQPHQQEQDEENEIQHFSVIQKAFKFTLDGSINSTIPELNGASIKFNQIFYSFYDVKIDMDVQLANEREISVQGNWLLPQRLEDMLSTRVELHIKTPFVRYQNVDIQAILGRKEDRDVLVLLGIYIENFQYAISITGTPRFEEDGALGFDVTTSNPKYDKIFGSFSYVIGDTTRLACQLGWPQVVIGLETGWEWLASDDFQIYYTFNSPWLPLKNINGRLKIDGTQSAELKLEANEDSINTKCEWSIINATNFEIRLDGSTPFESVRKFGFILQHSWDDEIEYGSQAMGFINDVQAGYKLAGGQSELEEEELVAIVNTCQLEIESVLYPKIQGMFNLAQRVTRFNLAASLTLREGPINVDGQLDLLDVFRFNENITITTPYPELLELEIELTPAFNFAKGLYNLGVGAKWRSHSERMEGGLYTRWGDQKILAEMLSSDVQNGGDYSDEDEDVEGIVGGNVETQVEVPLSQLFHFYSPLSWAKVIKLEYEATPSVSTDIDKGASQETEEIDMGTQNHFPIRNFVILYSAQLLDFTTSFHNLELSQRLMGVLDMRVSDERRLSLKLDGILDVSESERKFNILAASYHPTVTEFSVGSTWTNELPQYMQGRLEFKSPFQNWEEQSASIMYARNVDDDTTSADFEIQSISMAEKFATNVMIGPRHFSMSLNTPFEEFTEWELRGDTKDDEENIKLLNTLIRIKGAEKEVEIDVDSEMGNDDSNWPTKMTGSITASFLPKEYHRGEITSTLVLRKDNDVNANGEIEWKSNQERLKASLILLLPAVGTESRFRGLNLTLDTPFKGQEHWEFYVQYDHLPSGDDDEDTEEQPGAEIIIMVKSPMKNLKDIHLHALAEYPSESFLELKRASVKVDSGIGSCSLNTSWSLLAWNRANYLLESKYVLSLDEDTQASIPLISSWTNENALKLKFRNLIPTLNRLTNIDSRINFETLKPLYKISGAVGAAYEEGNSFSFKIATKHGKLSYAGEVSSNFTETFEDVKLAMGLTAGGFLSKSNAEWSFLEDDGILEGKAKIDWGSTDERQRSSAQSSFNCSWPIDNEIEFHIRVDFPTDSKLISIDGSFNGISSEHSARMQIGQDGLQDMKPIVINLQLLTESRYNFETALNFTSDWELVNDTGILFNNAIDGTKFDGLLGGHWNEDNLYVKYYVDVDNKEDGVYKFNVSLDTEVPFATESVPKPQTAFINVFYASEEEKQIMESGFTGVYNGVQLLQTFYQWAAESKAGFEKDEQSLKFENHFWPFQASLENRFEYSGGFQGYNYPTKMVKRFKVYDLGQPDLHKLEGELQIKTNFTGSEITFTAKHPKREIKLITDYALLDHRFKHSTRINMRPDTSLGYDLELMNRTNNELTEHELNFRLTYPIRVITLRSGYEYRPSSSSLTWTTEMNFNASKNTDGVLIGVITADILHPTLNSTLRKMGLRVKHPTLTQELVFGGQVQTDGWDMIEGKISMDYSTALNKGPEFVFRVEPLFSWGEEKEEGCRIPYWNITVDTRLVHSGSKLDAHSLHSTLHSDHELSIISLIDFKNSKKSLEEKQNEETKIAFELFKQLKTAHIMMLDPEDYLVLEVRSEIGQQAEGAVEEYTFIGVANISGIFPLPESRMTVDLKKPYFKMYALHGKDLSNGLHAEGGVIDSRNIKFDIWKNYGNFVVSDVNYFLRLNHSKLITSKLKWRPELFTEIKELWKEVRENVSRIVIMKYDRYIETAKRNARDSLTAIWDDAKGNLEPFIENLKEECNFKEDYDALRLYLTETYEENEFYIQDIHGYGQLLFEEIYAKILELLEKLKTYKDGLGYESFQAGERAVIWTIDKVKDCYDQLVTAWEKYKSNSSSAIYIAFAQIKEKLSLVLYYSVGAVIKLGGELYGSLSSLISSLALKLNNFLPPLKAFFQKFQLFIQDFILRLSEFISETKEKVEQWEYYQKLTKLMENIQEIYQELIENDFPTNFRKYSALLRNWIWGKLDKFFESFREISSKFSTCWEKLMGMEWLEDFKRMVGVWREKVDWILEYTNMKEGCEEFLLFLYTKGGDLFGLSVLEAGARYQTAKTKFIFDADKGIISLEQKLPMPWAAFNETPDFQQLPEYQNILKIQNLLKSSKGSFWDVYYKMMPELMNLQSLIPPFDGHAMLVGSDHFFTFDGLAYNLNISSSGPCTYLLAGDLVDLNFSIAIQYDGVGAGGNKSYNILVTSGSNTLLMDLNEKGLRDPKRNGQRLLNLPVQMQNLRGFQHGVELVVSSPKGISVSCNLMYHICQFHISGWYSRKTGGLLGTMDGERTSDLILNTGRRALDVPSMVNSWSLTTDDSCEKVGKSGHIKFDSSVVVVPSGKAVVIGKTQEEEELSSKIVSTCQKLFHSKMSSLQPCFATVNGDPYYEMCWKSTEEVSLCASAVAYSSSCRMNNIRLKIPSMCIKCSINGEEMIDRDMRVISSPPSGSPIFRSTDVVFIVEAKDCNRAIRSRRKIDDLVSSLERALLKERFKDNRYAAVVFGGDGVYDQPHPIVQNNEIFTRAETFGIYLGSLSTGNGNKDVFNAIWYSLENLNFRPGVSKTIVLFPCSSCQPQDTKMDFADLYYAMLEQGVTLHVIMDDHFITEKKNLAKRIFGIDNDSVFTNSASEPDSTNNTRKSDLRRMVKVPRNTLGYCSPLALQTNGSVFNGKKLQNRKENMIDIFSQRVVKSAVPSECQTCYCTQRDSVSKVECYECGYQRQQYQVQDDDDLIDSNRNGTNDSDSGIEDVYDDEMVDDNDD